MSWLDNLKEGDEVAVRSGYVYASHTIKIIERTTKSQIMVSGMKFWRESGSGVGYQSSPVRIVEPTPEIREEIKRRACVDKIQAFAGWHNLSTEVLEKVVELIKEVKQ
jgi:hypothetical protein